MSDAKVEYSKVEYPTEESKPKCGLCQKALDPRSSDVGDMSMVFKAGWTHYRCGLEALEDILSFVNEEHRLVVVKGAAAARMVTTADKTDSLLAILGALNRGNSAPWAEALEKTVEGLHMFEEGDWSQSKFFTVRDNNGNVLYIRMGRDAGWEGNR